MAWAKINDVYIDLLEDEQVSYSNEVTSNNVEDGRYITDHIENKPIEFSIKGKVISVEKIEKIREYWKNKEIITYVGINQFGNAAILSYQESVDSSTKNGITFSMSLRIIRIAKKSTVEISLSSLTFPDFSTIETTASDEPARAFERIQANAGRQAQLSTNLNLGERIKGAY